MAVQPPSLAVHQAEICTHVYSDLGAETASVDMHLYVGLLKEELATLWETPPRTWDAYGRDYFPMRVALLTIVQDYQIGRASCRERVYVLV